MIKHFIEFFLRFYRIQSSHRIINSQRAWWYSFSKSSQPTLKQGNNHFCFCWGTINSGSALDLVCAPWRLLNGALYAHIGAMMRRIHNRLQSQCNSPSNVTDLHIVLIIYTDSIRIVRVVRFADKVDPLALMHDTTVVAYTNNGHLHCTIELLVAVIISIWWRHSDKGGLGRRYSLFHGAFADWAVCTISCAEALDYVLVRFFFSSFALGQNFFQSLDFFGHIFFNKSLDFVYPIDSQINFCRRRSGHAALC